MRYYSYICRSKISINQMIFNLFFILLNQNKLFSRISESHNKCRLAIKNTAPNGMSKFMSSRKCINFLKFPIYFFINIKIFAMEWSDCAILKFPISIDIYCDTITCGVCDFFNNFPLIILYCRWH